MGIEIHPIPDQTAESVARKFTGEFVCRFGCPYELHSDQGRNFESKLFAEVLRSSYHDAEHQVRNSLPKQNIKYLSHSHR